MKRIRRSTLTKLDHRETIPESLLMNTEPVANESSNGLSTPVPPASPSALRTVHTPNFPELLRRLGALLLVTTYQAGKLVMVRDEGDHLNTHFRAFQAPMGLASRMIVWRSALPCRCGSLSMSRR